jgi:hypothetical protein
MPSPLYLDKQIYDFGKIASGITFEFNSKVQEGHPLFRFLFNDFEIAESKFTNTMGIDTFPEFQILGATPKTVYESVGFISRSEYMDTASLDGKISYEALNLNGADSMMTELVNMLYSRSMDFKLKQVSKTVKSMISDAKDYYDGKPFFDGGHATSNILQLTFANDSLENLQKGLLAGITHLTGIETKADSFPNSTVNNIGVLGNSSHQFSFHKLSPVPTNMFANADTAFYSDDFALQFKAVSLMNNVLGDKDIIVFSRDVGTYPMQARQYGGLDFQFFGDTDEKIDRFIRHENPDSVLFTSSLQYEIQPTKWHRAVLVKFL